MSPYEPGSLAHYSALEMQFDGPIPEDALCLYRQARAEREQRLEREAKESVTRKIGLAARMGIEQRMRRAE